MFSAEADTLRPFRETGTLEAFSESYTHTDSRVLDSRYNALGDLSLLRMRYIREHPEGFVPGPSGAVA